MADDTFSLGPNPKWYFVQKNGKPLSGGKFYTYSNLNNSLARNVYTDASLNFPLPNPADIDADGTLGPFWFAFDSTNPDQGYLIIVRDANGNEIWTVDNYFANGGGGGTITTGLNLDNLVTNNVMFRHTDTILTPVPTYSIIAPSNNAVLVANDTTPGTNPSPDIVFIKDTSSATDTITFPLISPLGDQPVVNDTAPVDFFNYSCSIADPVQMVKCLQFPITAKVQNLSNQTVIGSFWAIGNGGIANQQIVVQWMQYFGDGAGASPTLITPIDTLNIVNGAWTKSNFSSTVPSVSGKNLGAPTNQGPNDGLFLQFQFPLTTTCDIGFTKPTLFLGTTLPDLNFDSYDEIDSIISSPRTGDIRISANSFAPFGWVPCNDGVLSNGDIAIVKPALIARARNNIDTYPLYSLIWKMTSGYTTFAPIYTNAGVLTTRGATAIDDFSNGKQLSLTKMLGRVLAGTNAFATSSQSFTAVAATDQLTVTDASIFPTGTPVLVTNIVGSAPLATANVPNVYYALAVDATHIKLAKYLEDAQAGLSIDITSNGTGTIQSAIGTFFGEGGHIQTIAELVNHAHPGSTIGTTAIGAQGGLPNAALSSSTVDVSSTNPPLLVASQGGSQPFNIMQPTAFMNVFLKL